MAVLLGKISFVVARIFGKKGTAIPGKVALKFCPDLLLEMSDKCGDVVFITGTNGKTTINNLLTHVLKGEFQDVLSNLNGSNMIQGVLTPFITDYKDYYDVGVFEVDEGSVCRVSEYLKPDYFILTNFFRDQLDRYGEVESTIKMVHDSISPETVLIINSDEPSMLYFDDLPNKKVYYGLNKTKFIKHDMNVAESMFCPKCGSRLIYDYIYYGNVGKFHCDNCGVFNHKADYLLQSADLTDGVYEFTVKNKSVIENYALNLRGLYNLYNSLAVISLAGEMGLSYKMIYERIDKFEYSLGRMETFHHDNNECVLVLSKNPVSLSEIFYNISYDENEKSVMFILNDYASDGRDVSWIWDADFEIIKNIQNLKNFYCAGTRAEEVALRLKYAGINEKIFKIYSSGNIVNAIEDILNENHTSFIIATFTAMPEARKILLKKDDLL